MYVTDLFPDHGIDEIIIGAEDDVSILLQTTEGKVRAGLCAQTHIRVYIRDNTSLVVGPTAWCINIFCTTVMILHLKI